MIEPEFERNCVDSTLKKEAKRGWKKKNKPPQNTTQNQKLKNTRSGGGGEKQKRNWETKQKYEKKNQPIFFGFSE